MKYFIAALVHSIIIFLAAGQSSLSPMNRCLGNCAVCKNDDISTCSGKQFVDCTQGFNGQNCALKETYASQIVLVDSNANLANSLWSNRTVSKCTYNNSKQQRINVTLLGLQSQFGSNSITLDVQPYFINFILDFNLIRGSWTPFSDLLKITIVDQNQQTINDQFIQLSRRDDMNTIQNPMVCNKQNFINEKYEIKNVINPQKTYKITINFQGMIFSGGQWGLTNVKLAVGCSKMLLYDGNDCQMCAEGYYIVRYANKTISKCETCPISCTTCSEADVCLTCATGFNLVSGKCTNNYTVNMLAPANKKVTCENNKTFTMSSPDGSEQRLQVIVPALPSHANKTRVSFYLAYVPSQFLSTDIISIFIEGEDKASISGSELHTYETKPKQICKQFGSMGYYSLYKVITPYFMHNSSTVNVTLYANNVRKMGVSQVAFQYQPAKVPDPPKNNTTPNNTNDNTNANNNTVPNTVPNNTNSVIPNNTNNVPSSPIIPSSNPTDATAPAEANKTNTPINPPINPTTPTTPVTPTIPILPPVNPPSTPINNTIFPNITAPNNTNSNNNTNANNNNNGSTNAVTPNQTQLNDTTNNNNNNTAPTTNNNNNTNTNNNNNDSNINNTNNDTNNSNINTNDANTITISQAINKISYLKQQLKLQVQQKQQFIINVFYPLQLTAFPYITAHLINSNLIIPAQPQTYSNQYQQLTFDIPHSLLNQNIQLFMHSTNPIQLAHIQTNINNNNNRNLQATNNNDGVSMGSMAVHRYDKLSPQEISEATRFAVFFQIIALIAIISSFILSMFGSSVITQKLCLLLQIVFLHLYIYTEYLPINFKIIVGGLHRIQTLNYFTNSCAQAVEQLLLGNVVQYSPAKFTTFTKDINFSRAIYPSIIAIVVYLLSFIILNVLRKIIEPSMVSNDIDEEISKLDRVKLFICRTAQRFLNFWYQVWQYMYITFVFNGLVQLYNFSYPMGADRSPIPNAIFCIVCLVLAIVLPIVTFIYLNKKYFKTDYFEYTYWYENILFQKLPTQSLPSNHHRILILVRNIRYYLLAICFAFIGNYPVQALVVIILVHLFSLGYRKITHVEIKPFNSKLNIIQHILLILLAVLMIVVYFTSSAFSTEQYMNLGKVLVAICLALTIVAFVRVIYNIHYKVKDRKLQKQLSEFKPAIGTQRVV